MATSPSKKKITVIFCLMVFLSLASLSLSAQSLTDKEYIIGAGDVIEITVWDHEDLCCTVEVSQQGVFTFPLIGKVHAGGLSIFGLENLLKKRLGDGYLVSPQITVNVAEYKNQKVFLFGEVKKPGSYVLKQKIHLLKLISEAGGFTDKASHMVTIVKPLANQRASSPVSLEKAQKNKIITVDVNNITACDTDDSFLVTPGDSIYVRKASRIFVTGEVKKPGKFRWEKGLTVRQAISLAGGPSQAGAPKRTKIVRLENGIEKEFKPRMNEVVMPNDIVKVPERYF